MPTDTELQMLALDIESSSWEDLQREVVTADLDAIIPAFSDDVEASYLFQSGGGSACLPCACGGC